MHSIQALISTHAALTAAQPRLPGAVLCPMPQGFALMPVDALDEGFAAQLSLHAPVAFVSTEYFGGQGAQEARVWIDGQLALSLSDTTDAPASWPDSPISRALRSIGVVAAPGQDEFDTLGLGRHRSNERWLEAQAKA
jgi:hypothetical protein